MNKIYYPEGVTEKDDFHKGYYKVLTKKKESDINQHLKKIDLNGTSLSGQLLDLEKLVTLSFDELIELSSIIKKYSDALNHYTVANGKSLITNVFADLFDYKGNQPKLAKFFMTQKAMNLKTCCYCSIDHINSFVDFPDYKTGLDFANYADHSDLQFIDGMTNIIANNIIAGRGTTGYVNVEAVPAPKEIKEIIKKLPLENSHNHFTLDHIFPQKRYKFFSLCLYNLVPSCYACNSKFKKELEFDIDDRLKFISPTSESYNFKDNFKFKIFFSGAIDKITAENDFLIVKKVTDNEKHIQKHFRMFKILGRYVSHKDQIVRLIDRKVKYSDSRITEISNKTGISQKELRNLIFGEDLFSDKFDGNQLVKFRRDIADNINIKDVL